MLLFTSIFSKRFKIASHFTVFVSRKIVKVLSCYYRELDDFFKLFGKIIIEIQSMIKIKKSDNQNV